MANKIDVAGTEKACERLAERVRADALAEVGGDEFLLSESKTDPKLYRISALTGEGVEQLKAALATKVAAIREAQRELAASQTRYDHVWELKRDEKDKQFRVRKLSDGIFRVSGGAVERMVVQTDWENEEAIVFLQHRLRRMGVDAALEEAGAVDGDEIRIVGRAFTFESSSSADPYRELDL